MSDWDNKTLLGFAGVIAGGAAMVGIGQALQEASGISQAFQAIRGVLSAVSTISSGVSLMNGITEMASSIGGKSEIMNIFSNESSSSTKYDNSNRNEKTVNKHNLTIEGSWKFKFKVLVDLILTRCLGTNFAKEGLRYLSSHKNILIREATTDNLISFSDDPKTSIQNESTTIQLPGLSSYYGRRAQLMENNGTNLEYFTKTKLIYALSNELGNAIALSQDISGIVNQEWPDYGFEVKVKMRDVYSNTFENGIRSVLGSDQRCIVDHSTHLVFDNRNERNLFIRGIRIQNTIKLGIGNSREMRRCKKQLARIRSKAGQDSWAIYYLDKYNR